MGLIGCERKKVIVLFPLREGGGVDELNKGRSINES